MKITPATTGSATYCPEDDKLRLYVGRVPRAEYEALRAEGWTSTPKQSCDFVAVWTPEREDTALAYADGIIDDEDIDPGERAADRAERFQMYQGKRTDEATEHADAYDGQDMAHGFQDPRKAERAAQRHDRIADRATNAWNKAEYWQRRTEGVIRHAIYKSEPSVRMGRIKTLEADKRKRDKTREEYRKTWQGWRKVADHADADQLLPLDASGYCDVAACNAVQRFAYYLANARGSGYYLPHPSEACNDTGRAVHGESFHGFSPYDLMTHESYGGRAFVRLTPKAVALLVLDKLPNPDDLGTRWTDHFALRLAYENQMLAAQGGRVELLEMEAGGWIGPYQIQKVHKSPATGRVTSVTLDLAQGFRQIGGSQCYVSYGGKIELRHLPPSAYRAPTDEERAAFADAKKAAKDARGVRPIINPTDADAEALQTRWNADAAEKDKGSNYPRKASEVARMTSEQWARMYADWKTVSDLGNARVRAAWHHSAVNAVVILTDKPQKPLPVAAEMVTA